MTTLTNPPVEAVANSVVIRGMSPKIRDIEVRKMALRFNYAGASAFYGPFDVPSLNNGCIVSAFAHPFAVVQRTPSAPYPTGGDPSGTGDATIVRPHFLIRGPQRLAMFAGDQFNSLNPLGAIGSGDSIVPPLDAAAMRWGLAGDARDGIGNQGRNYGVPFGDHKRHARITCIVKTEPNPDDPSNLTDYYLALNIGQTVVETRGNSSTPPAVDDEYPAGQEATMFNHREGAIQRSVHETVPHQNARPVQNLEDDLEQNLLGHEYPYKIAHIDVVYDYPDNPTTQIKKITLNNGSTVTRPIGTDTVLGELIGDPTTADPGQGVLALNSWWEIEVFLCIARFPDANAGSLAGLAPDEWPLSVADTTP